MPSYEELGSFYLGREVDPNTGKDTSELLLYDSRDLTTHAVCVGMTGSGKTGLCLALLEEAAIDGVPALVIDPKGDLGNLALTFPQLRDTDFAPWVDAGEAARKGMSVADYAKATAETWRKGLAEWDEDGARIQKFRDAADVTIYTPGSSAGRPLSILRSFAAPSGDLLNDANALRERIAATVAGLLGLIGIDADPLKSREHILLSTIFNTSWAAGHDLDIASLIQSIQKPPFDKVGVFELETFYPAKERIELAMALNNLVAAPGFEAWMQGEALDIDRLLRTESGKPRISIISIAHLNDAERMFVVTLLLGETIAWMRRQSGTSSLRALIYMDEVFGYFPPTAMPPSKVPLLTLVKQARAFGLGVVLATQNPVDLDYKGLSNAGTWFIGRLQTERDKARVIEGLLSASGEGLEKGVLEKLLANLGNRVFLMRNAHEAAPVLFKTRWALSYLRGPMTLKEISGLSPSPASSTKPSTQKVGAKESSKPVVPADVPEFFLKSAASNPTYQAQVLAVTKLHFVDKGSDLDAWETRSWLGVLAADEQTIEWNESDEPLDSASMVSTLAAAGAQYSATPSAYLRASNYSIWQKQLLSYFSEAATRQVYRVPDLDLAMAPNESERDFRARVSMALREKRDAAIDKLRQKYAPRLQTLDDQLRRADERIERERGQLTDQKMQTAINVGTSILGALFGRKLSSSTFSRVGSAARGAGRIGRESADVDRAQESREVLQQRRTDLANELEQEIA
ncbi:MAG TPA: DUF87 domain-containing protein, partial [Steroidobacteraceae bacterium]|nr:DUF87 domain-containing protein [Steroidobacteraceae bacterium]